MTMEESFLTDIVSFLFQIRWLYDFPVTQVFTRNMLTQMPQEWSTTFANITLDDLNGIPECISQMHWPSSLKDFLQKCKSLSLQKWIANSHHEFTVNINPDLKLPKQFCKGMSAKKRHEVASVVHLVKQILTSTKCCHVLDIGSGMGYVDSLLHHSLKITVMGAESEDIRVKNAQSRQEGITGFCGGIKHVNWVLNDDQVTINNAEEYIDVLMNMDITCTCNINHQNLQKKTCADECHSIKEIVARKPDHSVEEDSIKDGEETPFTFDSFASKSVMLLGLHSCADLSPVMMKIFKCCPEISSLVLFSCCYHKLEQSNAYKSLGKNDIVHKLDNSYERKESNGEASKSFDEVFVEGHEENGKNGETSFANFPMSRTLKKIMQEKEFQMSIFGLRLAAQESGVRWMHYTEEDHRSHEKNVAYRALLEVFCQKEGLKLKKRRRRCARKSKFLDFSEYVKTVIENYEFVPTKNETQDSVEDNFQSAGTEENMDNRSALNSVLLEDCSSRNAKARHITESLNEEKNFLSPEYITEGLNQCYATYEHIFPLLEPLTGLQLALQPVVEALVLVDRIVYLKECQFENVWLERVFDVSISPRNVALIAIR